MTGNYEYWQSIFMNVQSRHTVELLGFQNDLLKQLTNEIFAEDGWRLNYLDRSLENEAEYQGHGGYEYELAMTQVDEPVIDIDWMREGF